MDPTLVEDKTFDKIDFSLNPFFKGEYESCTFNNCDFSNIDLSDSSFIECSFITCNLSLAKLINTAFRNAVFKDCKMLGLRFENCNKFGFAVSLDNCILNHSSFYQTSLKKIIIKNSKLEEVDFTDCDLSNSVFENCDLTRAVFSNTKLEKADLQTSYNFSIDPEINRIKKAKFSLLGLSGLLEKYDIEIDS